MLIIGLKMIQPKIVSKTLQCCTWHFLGVEKWNFPVRFRAFLEDWYPRKQAYWNLSSCFEWNTLLQPKILSFLCSHLDISLTTGAGAVPFTVFIFINNIDSGILINAVHLHQQSTCMSWLFKFALGQVIEASIDNNIMLCYWTPSKK